MRKSADGIVVVAATDAEPLACFQTVTVTVAATATATTAASAATASMLRFWHLRVKRYFGGEYEY